MGMYDEIKCDYPLPGAPKEVQNSIFQTKDFYNVMDSYTITKEGRLIFHKKIYEEVPEEKRLYYGKEEWNNPLFKMAGCLKSKHIADIDMQHHGYINIYTVVNDNPFEGWFEYRIKFTDGKVVDVQKIQELETEKS